MAEERGKIIFSKWNRVNNNHSLHTSTMQHTPKYALMLQTEKTLKIAVFGKLFPSFHLNPISLHVALYQYRQFFHISRNLSSIFRATHNFIIMKELLKSGSHSMVLPQTERKITLPANHVTTWALNTLHKRNHPRWCTYNFVVRRSQRAHAGA